jgi:hypothetical protein
MLYPSTTIQPTPPRPDKVHWYKSTTGATPKLTKSAKESSSAPNRDALFNARARRPSRPSKIPARMMAPTAKAQSSDKANRIDVSPAHKEITVIMFGIMLVNDKDRSRDRLGCRVT